MTAVSEGMFDSGEKEVVGQITNRFLSSGQGTPAREIRVKLGGSRRLLDQLVAKRAIRLCGDKYYPCFLALEAMESSVREFIRRSTALVLEALKVLYKGSGKDQFSFAEVLAQVQRIDESASAEQVNLGMLMASDFNAYIMTWGFGGRDTPNSEWVGPIGVKEDILDYENIGQAWEHEVENRTPVALRDETSGPSGSSPRDWEMDALDISPQRAKPTKGDLHPWGVIFSMISRLTSDGLLSVVSTTGLQVDWTLTKDESYSHKTRIRTYLPRVQAAYDALPEEKRLIVAALAAVELARSYPAVAGDLISQLSKVGWRLEDERLIPAEPDVRELFFAKGSQHDAYVESRSLLQRAKKSVILIDPWVDSSLFLLLASIVGTDLKVNLLTSRAPADFNLEAKKFLAQHPRFRMQVRQTAEFHDRFIVIDGNICFHVGASVKDAGSKAFMISQIEDARNREALLDQYHQSWDAAKVVFP